MEKSIGANMRKLWDKIVKSVVGWLFRNLEKKPSYTILWAGELENMIKAKEFIDKENAKMHVIINNIQNMQRNREWHITELRNTIGNEFSQAESIAMTANSIFNQIDEIMRGKGYNYMQRWVIFNPSMSMPNERVVRPNQQRST